MMTLAALIVPLIEGREAGWPLWSWLSLGGVPLLAWHFWRYETRLARMGGTPLIDPASLQAPGLGRALMIALLFYGITPFFPLFSVYLQNALHVTALSAGPAFLPFGADSCWGHWQLPSAAGSSGPMSMRSAWGWRASGSSA